MNQLVFISDGQVVTDSLKIAEVFEKEHARVMRDIRDLECSEEFRVGNFAESTYTNVQGREMPKYHMNRKGFTLLAMGYTGKRAMEFKEAYIEKFDEMEKSLNAPRQLTEKEQLKASMRLSLETSEELEEVKEEVAEVRSMVENQITLDHREQRGLQRAVARRVYELYENKDDRPQGFSAIYREIKDRFGVASYKDVKRKDLLTAIRYVNAWVPKRVA